MTRLLALLCVLSLLCLQTFAQSANFRAQARYYSAKSAYEAGKFDDAVRMLFESRQFLEGKSNPQLQHILVLSLYKAGRFKEAQTEMSRFFTLHEGKEDRAHFTEDVDELTNNEVREITIILDDIDDKVRRDIEGEKKRVIEAKRLAEQRRAWEADLTQWRNARRMQIASRVHAVLSSGYVANYTTPNGTKTTQYGSASFTYIEGTGYRIQTRSQSHSPRWGGLYGEQNMTATWPSCAGITASYKLRSGSDRTYLSTDDLWLRLPASEFYRESENKEGDAGRLSRTRYDSGRTSGVSVENIRLQGGEASFNEIASVLKELSDLDSLSFDALHALRASGK
jgi:hypothetical protein